MVTQLETFEENQYYYIMGKEEVGEKLLAPPVFFDSNGITLYPTNNAKTMALKALVLLEANHYF